MLESAKSGRVLEVETTQPGSTGLHRQLVGGCPESKSGRGYEDYDGVAIECQGMPDAPNHRNFPSQLLGVGEVYDQTIVYRFKTK